MRVGLNMTRGTDVVECSRVAVTTVVTTVVTTIVASFSNYNSKYSSIVATVCEVQ